MKIIVPAFSAAAVLIVLSILLLRSPSDEFEELSMSQRLVKGSAYSNGTPVKSGDRFSGGVELTTGSDSRLDIFSDTLFHIQIHENTGLLIDESVYSGRNDEYSLRFTLHRGSVHSRFSPGTRRLRYAFITRKARIDSIGTEFILSASDDETRVILLEGSVRITSLVSGHTISAEPKEYIITSSIQSRDLTAGETAGRKDVPSSEKSPVVQEQNKEAPDQIKKDESGTKEREVLRDMKREMKDSNRELRRMQRSRESMRR